MSLMITIRKTLLGR